MYSQNMILVLFPLIGMAMLVVLTLVARRIERDSYCDHGPSVYDSYCPKCGLDS